MKPRHRKTSLVPGDRRGETQGISLGGKARSRVPDCGIGGQRGINMMSGRELKLKT